MKKTILTSAAVAACLLITACDSSPTAAEFKTTLEAAISTEYPGAENINVQINSHKCETKLENVYKCTLDVNATFMRPVRKSLFSKETTMQEFRRENVVSTRTVKRTDKGLVVVSSVE